MSDGTSPMTVSDPLADVIGKARCGCSLEACRQSDRNRKAAAAVRAAGYKSPEEIAKVLRDEEAKWDNGPLGNTSDAEVAINSLRAALLGDDRG